MTYAALWFAFFAGVFAQIAFVKRWLGFEWRIDAALALAAGAASVLMVAL